MQSSSVCFQNFQSNLWKTILVIQTELCSCLLFRHQVTSVCVQAYKHFSWNVPPRPYASSSIGKRPMNSSKWSSKNGCLARVIHFWGSKHLKLEICLCFFALAGCIPFFCILAWLHDHGLQWCGHPCLNFASKAAEGPKHRGLLLRQNPKPQSTSQNAIVPAFSISLRVPSAPRFSRAVRCRLYPPKSSSAPWSKGGWTFFFSKNNPNLPTQSISIDYNHPAVTRQACTDQQHPARCLHLLSLILRINELSRRSIDTI